MGKMTRLEARIRSGGVGLGCRLCGGAASFDDLTLPGVKDEGPSQACDECVNAGPRGAAARARVYARVLREEADWVERMAASLESGGSLAEVIEAVKRWRRARRRKFLRDRRKACAAEPGAAPEGKDSAQ